jgi:hypothetical protein
MSADNDPTSIGNVLVELGCCTQGDVDEALRLMQNTRTVGQTLVETGIVSGEQLEWAVTYQKVLRRQTTAAEAKNFESLQRGELLRELGELPNAALAFMAKVKNGI